MITITIIINIYTMNITNKSIFIIILLLLLSFLCKMKQPMSNGHVVDPTERAPSVGACYCFYYFY